jgi:UPF0176 protein
LGGGGVVCAHLSTWCMATQAGVAKARVVSFFRYVHLDPIMTRLRLRPQLEAIGVVGRIVLAPEGMNLQAAVREDRLEDLQGLLGSEMGLGKDVRLNVDKEVYERVEDAFGRLRIRVRDRLVAEAEETERFVPATSRTLSPRDFHAKLLGMVGGGGGGGVVLDARNLYESEVGRFEGATSLDCSTHLEAAAAARRALASVPKEAPVLMYCTGGIRCEKLAEMVADMGYRDVFGLKGGVVAYAREIPREESLFRGVNVVFDRRRAVAVTQDATGTCISCGARTSRITNCGNKACGAILVQCEDCGAALHGACSPSCACAMSLPQAWRERLVRLPVVRHVVHTKHDHRSIARRAAFPQWQALPSAERRQRLVDTTAAFLARTRARPDLAYALAVCTALIQKVAVPRKSRHTSDKAAGPISVQQSPLG